MKNKLIPKHQNATGPLLPNNYVVKPVWQQQEKNYTPEWLKKLSPQEETRLKTIQESERKRKEHLKAKRTEYLGDWGVMSRSMRTANPVSVLHHHLQNQGYGEQAKLMAKNTGSAEAGVLIAIPSMYGLATAPIATLTSMGTGYLGSKTGKYIGEAAETHLGAPEYTSDVLGLAGGLIGGIGGAKYSMNSPTVQAAELPFQANSLKSLNAYGSKRFWHDVITDPRKMLSTREQGWYPLTFSERKLMMQTLKSKINKGMEYAASRGKTLGLIPNDIKVDPKMTFTGAQTAANRYGEGAFLDKSPNQLSFSAFHNTHDGLTFPLRTNTRSLLPNLHLMREPVLIGAHEAQHEVQKNFIQPLTRYREFIPKAYNRYLHSNLDPNVKRAAANIIKTAKTKGLWEGSLSEMDAELVGWMAENNFPAQWSNLYLYQREFLAKKAAKRFGLSENEYPLFSMLFKNMEDAGY